MLICLPGSSGRGFPCMLIALPAPWEGSSIYANYLTGASGRGHTVLIPPGAGPRCMLIARGRGQPRADSRSAALDRGAGAAPRRRGSARLGAARLRPMRAPGSALGPAPGRARPTMEVEDSGGVVLTAYHSYARSQPPAASHPLSRYRGRAGPGGRAPGGLRGGTEAPQPGRGASPRPAAAGRGACSGQLCVGLGCCQPPRAGALAAVRGETGHANELEQAESPAPQDLQKRFYF